MIFSKCKKNFVSEIDQFLAEFDKHNPQKSPSQEFEIAKYERVGRLRDKHPVEHQQDELWKDF